MALIEYDDSSKAIMSNNSYVAPKPEEYELSNMGALFKSMNIAGALGERGDSERMAVDLAKYEGIEFNRPNLEAQLKEQGYSADIINNVMQSHLTDWTEAERRAKYFEKKAKREQQVAENFSTAEMLLYGLPMALVDVDAPLGGAIFKGVGAANKALKAGTAGRVATSAIGAGTFGAASLTGYEAVSGDYEDGSATHAFLLGSALGGGLGLLTAKSDAEGVFSRKFDDTGKEISGEEAKVTQLASHKERLDAVNAVVEKVKQARAARAEATKDLSKSQAQDKAVNRVDVRKSQTATGKAYSYMQGVVEDTKKLLNEAAKRTAEKSKQVKQLTDDLIKGEEATVQFGRDRAELNRLISERAPLKKRINDLQLKIQSLEAKLAKGVEKAKTAATVAERKAIRENNTKLRNELRPLKQKRTKDSATLRKADAAVKMAEKRVSKYDPKTVGRMKEGLANLPKLQKELSTLQKAEDDMVGRLDNEQTRLKVAKDTHRNNTLKNSTVTESLTTKNLQKIIDDADATLSPEGLKKLMDEQKVLADDIAKMEAGDFNTKALYGIRKEARTAFEKLNDEIKDLARLDTLADSAPMKRLPDWARKMLISPISRLLNSKNDMVAGFASYLHSGTLNQGKIRPMTAWIIKNMLDTELDRAHKAIRFNYSQAVKAGYTGDYKSFENAVAQNAYGVAGRMQRELMTGIDGAIKGEERLAIAQSRLGSVQRMHNSGNAWIDKSVDSYLDYYEKVYQRGSKADLEAFRNVLGKGYVKRMYSADKIKRMGADRAIKKLTDAQYAYAVSTNSAVTPAIMAEFKANARTAVEAALGLGYKHGEITKPLGITRKGTEASLRMRSIEAFDDDIVDLLEDDLIGTSYAYSLQSHGRIALKEKLGADTDDQVEEMIQQLGATDKEVDMLRAVVETIRGTREISKNPLEPVTRGLKFLSSVSSAMQIMGFGLTTTTEISALAKDFGWKRSVGSLVGNPREIYKMYRYGTPSEKNTVELMVSYADANFSHRAIRNDVETGFDSVGRFQEFMDGVVARGAVYGGLLPITDMLRMSAASLTVDFLARMSVAKKISNADLKRLEDIGWTPDMLPRIKKTLRVDANGRIGNMDRATWGKLDEEITASVMTNVERTILHPNGATLPMFMTNMNEGQLVPRLMMKFMRFPVESYERLLVRGMQEADAKQLMGLVGNVAMWTAILSMKDAMRDPDRQAYVGDEGLNQLIIDSLLHNSVTSSIPSSLDLISGLTTGENLTNDYTFRVGGAPQAAYETIMQGKLRANVFGYSAQADIGTGVADAVNTIFRLQEFNDD